MLQCVVQFVLQCVLQCSAIFFVGECSAATRKSSVTVCCSVMPCVATWYSMSQCVAVCCSVSQRVIACCAVLP